MGKRLDTVLQMGRCNALLGILRLSDEEAYLHCLECGAIVETYIDIALELGELAWDEEKIQDVLIGTLLHDFGNAFLPFGLQHSGSGSLTPEQKEIINIHPLLGIVAVQNLGFSDVVCNIIRMHHANADGSGYPAIGGKQLTEAEVPDYVWIVAYADRFNATITDRHFKKARNYVQAWNIMLSMVKDGKLPHQYARIFNEVIRKRSLLPIPEYAE